MTAGRKSMCGQAAFQLVMFWIAWAAAALCRVLSAAGEICRPGSIKLCFRFFEVAFFLATCGGHGELQMVEEPFAGAHAGRSYRFCFSLAAQVAA